MVACRIRIRGELQGREEGGVVLDLGGLSVRMSRLARQGVT